MPEIILAKTAGFCFGVTKAVDKVYELAETASQDIYTFGPIIHNEEVVGDLEKRGVHAISMEEARKIPAGSTVVIRSHGITKDEEEELGSMGLNVVDATCPFVKKIHKIVEDAARSGETVVIVGDPDHPEVKGIYSRSGKSAFVVGEEEDVEKLPNLGEVIVVSQTTFNYEKFNKIVEKITLKCYNIRVMNTICNATQERQTEAKKIATCVDAMLVIGGGNSSNSQKLFSICKEVCKNTFFIQTARDLEKMDFPKVSSIGITAGASTPSNIIQEVLEHVRTKL